MQWQINICYILRLHAWKILTKKLKHFFTGKNNSVSIWLFSKPQKVANFPQNLINMPNHLSDVMQPNPSYQQMLHVVYLCSEITCLHSQELFKLSNI